MTKPPFEQIVSDHGPTVLRVCRAVLGPNDAEDAWSETFLAAMKAYPRLAVDANIEAWLVTIAHRKAIDIVRANNRRPIAVDEPPEPPPPAHTGSTPGRGGALWDEASWDGALWDALKALPERQRQTVAYHHVAGMPYKEIAALIGGSADAARRAAADGIKRLRSTYPQLIAERGARQ